MLVPPFAPHPEWAESLAASLLNPEFPISKWEAFGRRFRRNYMWIYLVLAIAWALKGFLNPSQPASMRKFSRSSNQIRDEDHAKQRKTTYRHTRESDAQ